MCRVEESVRGGRVPRVSVEGRTRASRLVPSRRGTVLFWAFFGGTSSEAILLTEFGHFLATLRIRFVINYQLIC